MSYLLARLRLWAAHHRVIWWTCAIAFAGLTGITVRAATSVAPCTTAAETTSDVPTSGERGVALGRCPDPLPVEVGDRLDLWSVDGITARGRLVVSCARVLDHDDRTVTVAIPADRVSRSPPPWAVATCSRYFCPDWQRLCRPRPSPQRGGQQPEDAQADHHPVYGETS